LVRKNPSTTFQFNRQQSSLYSIAIDDPHLEEDVRNFEPQSAYFADNHGLSDIEKIVNQASGFLKEGGALLIEHGFEQGEVVRDCFQQAGFESVVTVRDFNQLERVTLAVR
jgi:release factor glutamine methyltransferase